MNEEKIKTDQKNNDSKNKVFSLKRFILLFVIVLFGYFGLRHFEIKQAQKLNPKNESTQLSNIESEIFELAEEYKNGFNHDSQQISDISLNEVQEKGAEFIYKMLLKNQQQINDLKQQNQALNAEFVKYKNQQKLAKIIFSYVDFRQKLFAGAVYEDDLKNFEALTIFDQNLQDKVAKLRLQLKNFSQAKKINEDFFNLIPEIIATKNSDSNQRFIANIRRNITKLVTIRRIDEKNPQDVDGIIVRAEKFLQMEKYQEALEVLLMLDQSYHEVLANFLINLSADAEVKKIDSEILFYLKNLS